MKTTILTLTATVVLLAATPAAAQRGLGDPAGIVRQDTPVQRATLTGTLVAVKTGPCELTTGRYGIGTHFILKTEAHGDVNLHLGPSAVVDDLVERIDVGDRVTVEAFRTEKMEAGAFVAQTIEAEGRTVALRDEALRPSWAGSAGVGPGRGNRGGRGAGVGRRFRN